MQVKKFEAPTIQEALDTIKRELGPEAIILQTKKYKRGFGLMSKASVEVTAAVSERSLQKKTITEKRMPERTVNSLKKMPAEKQAEFYDRYIEKKLEQNASTTRDRVELHSSSGVPAKKLTASTRYIDIDQETSAPRQQPRAQSQPQQQSQPRTQSMRYADIDSEEVEQQTSALSQPQGQGQAQRRYAPGMSLEEEVRHLKRMLEELKTNQDSQVSSAPAATPLQGSLTTPALQDAFEQLTVNGMEKRFALNVMRQVGFELGDERGQDPEQVLDQLAVEIMKGIEVSSPLANIHPKRNETDYPTVVALVGPTGVGKTTTVAKVASEALLRRNLKVGLINLDSYKVAAFDQLGTYAKILKVPFRSVATVEDLKAAIQDFRGLDLVLIDTTGRSQRDPNSLKEMQAMLEAVPGGIRTQLVMSVTTRDTELYDMANRFMMFRPEGLILSKLDEGTIYGAIFNVCQKVKLPLLYFTTGQRVPEDIEEATRERVVALILEL